MSASIPASPATAAAAVRPAEREAPAALSRADAWISWALFAGGFLALFATEKAIGFVRDENPYFAAGESYAVWFQLLFQNPALALTDPAIVRFWDINHQHPALLKALFGLSHLVFHQWLGWMRSATALRLPAFAAAAMIPALAYRMGARLFGRTAALFAAVSFLLVPRHFFHAQLAAFDVPVAAMWLLTVYAFWRAQETRHGWIACGVAFGLTLATKHNGFFLPLVLAPFALQRAYASSREDPKLRAAVEGFLWAAGAGALLIAVLFAIVGREHFAERFLLLSPQTAVCVATLAATGYLLFRLQERGPAAFRALAPLWAMAAIGPAVLYAVWPYLWHHPVDRLAWWLAFHAGHENYTWFYLGRLLREPPFPLEYVVVKTALTMPASLFVPACLGLFALAARAVAGAVPRWRAALPKVSWSEALVAVNALGSIAIISHPDVPHFGGVKHWLPSMPFLALLGGTSVARAAGLGWDALRARAPRLPEAAVSSALFALLFAPALIGLWRVHPYGTSSYGELAGGIPGAASLGMQRQFWSSNVTGALPWINEHAPWGARLYLHEVISFGDYQRNGMLRPDLRPVDRPQDADIAVYQYHQEFREQEMNIWQVFGTTKPVHGLYVDETPQIVVYRRPGVGDWQGGRR